MPKTFIPPPGNLPPPPGQDHLYPESPSVSPKNGKKFPWIPVVAGLVVVATAAGIGIGISLGKKKNDASGSAENPPAESSVVKLDKALPNFGEPAGTTPGLVGRFYDLKRTPDGSDIAGNPFKSNFVPKFLTGEINPDKEFHRSEKSLVSARVLFAARPAKEVAALFGEESVTGPWAIVYRGKVQAPFTGKFRFVGSAWMRLGVSFDGRPALDSVQDTKPPADGMVVPGEIRYQFLKYGKWVGITMRSGPWISVEKGRTYPVEIAATTSGWDKGKEPVGFYLLLEREGRAYETGSNGYTVFDTFRVLDEPKPDGSIPQCNLGPVFPIVREPSKK